MPSGDDLQWTEINDFSAGIYGDYLGGTTATSRGSIPKNGAAVIDGTWRCCADTSGALVPLPRGVALGYTESLRGTTTTPTFYPTNYQAMYATDAIALGRFYDLNPVSSDGEAFAVGYTWMMDTAGASTYRKHYLVRLFKNWQGGTKRDPLYAKSNVQTTDTGIGQVTLASARHNYTGTSYGQYLIMAINNMDGLTGFATGAIPAGEQTFTTFGTDNTNLWTYPSNSADIFNWPQQFLPQNRTAQNALTGVQWADDVVGHQGRVVTNIQYFEPFGAGTELWYTDKVQYNGTPNLLGTAPSTAQYGEENVSGIAFMASMTADELLVMKHDGGGYMVRGDLSNPVVSRLPMIESPHGVKVHPVSTPIGLVYATRDGIFAWSGGDVSKKLSTQIEGFFFKHELSTEKYTGFRGRMAWFHPFVAVPNSYLLDTRNGAWWRLESPGSYPAFNIYVTVPSSGKMYAIPYKITSSSTTVGVEYDPALLSNTYSWRSQPMVETLDRLESYQEIMLIASPGSHTTAHTVTITLSGFDGNGAAVTPIATTFTFTGTGTGNPVIVRKKIATFQAMQVQVRIQATAGGDAACKIHAVRLGHASRNRNPAS